MRKNIIIILVGILVLSCSTQADRNTSEGIKTMLPGTWKLISGTLIEKGDTTVTDYTNNKSFIKIINDTHFSFLQHDLHKGKDSAVAVFSAGGGKYSLKDSSYTEHLEYCSDRGWEGNDFTFTISLNADTLVQRGIEKVESEGINRINIEKYTRIK